MKSNDEWQNQILLGDNDDLNATLPEQGSALIVCSNAAGKDQNVESQIRDVLNRIATALESIHQIGERISDHVAPEPDPIVGTTFVAARLGCSVVWITEMVRDGQIPQGCIVPGTGNGKPWKFDRRKIEAWIKSR